MKVIVTCGPSYEPIDCVRRLTNFSTGELGVMLSNALTRAGCEVFCFKGAGASCAKRVEAARVVEFATNAELRAALADIANHEKIAAIFHAAALCDFKVTEVRDSRGHSLASAKIASNERIQLVLEPAAKLIRELRNFFPNALIV